MNRQYHINGLHKKRQKDTEIPSASHENKTKWQWKPRVYTRRRFDEQTKEFLFGILFFLHYFGRWPFKIYVWSHKISAAIAHLFLFGISGWTSIASGLWWIFVLYKIYAHIHIFCLGWYSHRIQHLIPERFSRWCFQPFFFSSVSPVSFPLFGFSLNSLFCFFFCFSGIMHASHTKAILTLVTGCPSVILNIRRIQWTELTVLHLTKIYDRFETHSYQNIDVTT